ncbi:MAG: hypothetical protein IKZ82_11085 [Clostridia bacterium]|nr:hypothetical protein [Clostridia bacterium]
MKRASECGGDTRLDLNSFLPTVFSSARCFASMLCPEIVEGVKVAVHPTCAAVKLKYPSIGLEGFDRLAACFGEFCASGASKIEETPIFGSVVPGRHTLLLEIADGFLLAFAEEAALSYEHILPEKISIPVGGAAHSSDSSAYVRSRLYAVSKTALTEHESASLNALFRCLCLFSADALGLDSAHSSAVRASLAACERGDLGRVDSAAMAAALLYAEAPQTN